MLTSSRDVFDGERGDSELLIVGLELFPSLASVEANKVLEIGANLVRLKPWDC